MAGAANYAWANRQCMAHLARRSFEEVLAGKVLDFDLYTVYDVAHSIAKIEQHTVKDTQNEGLTILHSDFSYPPAEFGCYS